MLRVTPPLKLYRHLRSGFPRLCDCGFVDIPGIVINVVDKVFLSYSSVSVAISWAAPPLAPRSWGGVAGIEMTPSNASTKRDFSSVPATGLLWQIGNGLTAIAPESELSTDRFPHFSEPALVCRGVMMGARRSWDEGRGGRGQVVKTSRGRPDHISPVDCRAARGESPPHRTAPSAALNFSQLDKGRSERRRGAARIARGRAQTFLSERPASVRRWGI